MKAKEIFGLIVRIIGLLFLYRALEGIPQAIMAFCPLFPHFNFSSLWGSIFFIGWPLVVAYWLISGAPQIMRRAYPDTPNSPQ